MLISFSCHLSRNIYFQTRFLYVLISFSCHLSRNIHFKLASFTCLFLFSCHLSRNIYFQTRFLYVPISFFCHLSRNIYFQTRFLYVPISFSCHLSRNIYFKLASFTCLFLFLATCHVIILYFSLIPTFTITTNLILARKQLLIYSHPLRLKVNFHYSLHVKYKFFHEFLLILN